MCHHTSHPQVGHSWGLKFTLDGRQLVSAPELGPMLRLRGGGSSGAVGAAGADPAADRLLALLHDYGPLWQVRGVSCA